MVERTLTLNDLFGVWRRRRLPMLLAMLVVLVGSVAIALYLPPLYRSTATVSVERTEFPSGLVGTSIPGYAAEQIQTAAQRVMTLENLWAIAQEFNLYPEERQQPDISTDRRIQDSG